MNIFELDNNYPTIKPEYLTVPEIKKIWDRDKTKNKEKAISQLAYIYFMFSTKSGYLCYSEEEMEERICMDLFGTKTYTPDADLEKAIEKFIEFSETPSTGLLKDARSAVTEIRKFLRDVDLTERTKAGTPVYKASEVTKTLSELDKVVESLQRIEERINKEDYGTGKGLGGTMGGPKEFDDD